MARGAALTSLATTSQSSRSRKKEVTLMSSFDISESTSSGSFLSRRAYSCSVAVRDENMQCAMRRETMFEW